MAKEALQSPSANLFFRETFRSEAETRRNGGTPTDVTFANGVATLDRDNSGLLSFDSYLNGTYSLRIKLKINELNSSLPPHIWDFRESSGTGDIVINENSSKLISSTSGIVYVNGAGHSSALSEGVWYDIIVSGISVVSTTPVSIGCAYVSKTAQRADWDIELMEYYQGTLTESEIKNLYDNDWNREYYSPNLLLDFDSSQGGLIDHAYGVKLGSDIVNASPPDFVTDSWSEGTLTNINGSLTYRFNTSSTSDTTGIYKALFTAGKSYKIEVKGFTYGTGVKFQSDFATADGDNTIIESTNIGYFSIKSEVFVADSTELFIHPTSNGTVDINELVVYEVKGAITGTDVVTKKNGSYYSADFNGSSSSINCNDNFIGTKDTTIICWQKTKLLGVSSAPISSGGLIVRGSTVNRVAVIASSTGISSTNAVESNIWQMFAYTITTSGTLNMYVANSNVAPKLTGSADQAIGARNESSTVVIGNDGLGSRFYGGKIQQVKVYEGILSLEDITNIWSDTRKYLI